MHSDRFRRYPESRLNRGVKAREKKDRKELVFDSRTRGHPPQTVLLQKRRFSGKLCF